jgi:hypothetical protein
MKSDTKSPEKPQPDKSFPRPADLPEEKGGRAGPEPNRYGDWENRGKCVDF